MIYSSRLRLRAAEREDIPRFVTWLNDPEVRQYLLLAYPMSQVAEEKWFQKMAEGNPAEHVMVIEVKINGQWKAIGTTSFMDVDWVSRKGEIGIFIGEKDCWNQGYGRDVMKLMLRHGFKTINLHRIHLRVHVDNVRGIKAYEHAGFVREGILRDDIFRDGKYHDVLVMAVLSTEWQDSDF
jgi:RimJ/RimL family protein N-acetyltransferase